MTDRFIRMNRTNSSWAGVFDCQLNTWVVEPEYDWQTAETMARALNANPDLDPDELTRIAEAV